MAPLLLLAALQSSGLVDLVSRLADDDVDVRERATQELIRVGELAHPDLERAASSDDPELASRAQSILSATGPMRISVEVSKDGRPSVTWSLKNLTAEEEIYFVPGFRRRTLLLELYEDPDGARLGWRGGGRRRLDCPLDEADFMTVWIGERHELRIDDLRGCGMEIDPPLLARHPELEMKAVGLAGRYRLEYSYRFDRAAYKRRCAKNCPSHDDPAMPWNRAFTRPLDASAEFTLR